MARPVGDDSSKPPTAISRPDGGWFARIWNPRNPDGVAGSGAGSSALAPIQLGRSDPFTLWTRAAAQPAAPGAVSASAAKSVSAAAGAFTLWTGGADASPADSGADAEPSSGSATRPADSRAFTLWTGSDAGAAAAVPAAGGGESSDSASVPRAADSRAFTLWTGADASRVAAGVAALPDLTADDRDEEADQASPKSTAPGEASPEGVPALAEGPISLDRSAAFTLWSGGGEGSPADVTSISTAPAAAAAAIAPIPLTDSSAFTLWAGGASDPESIPISTASMTHSPTSSDRSNGGSKAFTLWAPAAAAGGSAAAVAAPPADAAAPDRDEPKWERAVDQPRQESANLLPLLAAALTLIALLIALFVIADRNKEVRRLEGRVGTLTSEKEQLGKDGAKRETKLQAARTELATTSNDLAAAKEAHSAEVAKFESQVGGLQTTLKGTQDKLAATEKERDGLAAEKVAAEKQIGDLKISLTDAKAASQAAAKVAAEKLTKAETAAAETGKKLAASEARIGELGKRITDLGKEIETLKAKITDLESATPEEPAEPKPDTPPEAPDAAEEPEMPEAPEKDDGPTQV